jgi:phytanoyl-CoA hydroxylase
MPENPISVRMLEEYWRDGYVVVRGLVPEADLARYLARLEAIVSGAVPAPDGMLVMRDVMVAKGLVEPPDTMAGIAKLQDYEDDPVLDGYTTHPAVLDCVERVIGADVMTLHTMLINKPPGVDGRHPLHQDLLYFPFRPADKIVASWTALQRVHRGNGCLSVVPGSHRGILRRHESPSAIEHLNRAYFGAVDVEGDIPRRVHVEMEPGDTVFFHPVLLHGSGRNCTEGFRRAISAHYAAVDVEWAWTHGAMGNRRYRIVRGERTGEAWAGGHRPHVDPSDYLPIPKLASTK